jgi:hypothetical protein
MFLWTAFTIGLFGSLHCAGMCGPIAVAAGGGKRQLLGNALSYNLGRTVTYSLLGMLIGLIGKGLFLAGFQKYLSIAAGIGLLAIAVFSINVETELLSIPSLNRLIFRLKANLGIFLKQHGGNAAFMVGLLNGLLPCGLVYMAMVGAVSTGGVFPAMGYMALFGLGTVPMLLVTGLAGQWASLWARNALRKAYPFFIVFFGLLFLFRGLNFQVPGDFFFWEKMSDVPMCH